MYSNLLMVIIKINPLLIFGIENVHLCPYTGRQRNTFIPLSFCGFIDDKYSLNKLLFLL